MATKIYDSKIIKLVDGTRVKLIPLKLKFLREFMDVFEFVKTSKTEGDSIFFISECARIAMQQYYPQIKTIEDVEDNLDMPTIYTILDIAAGIRLNDKNTDKEIKEQASETATTWEGLDLAKIEAEVFLLGKWKDYEELELSLSMPELIMTLSSKRELDYQEKKFLAAIQGVDLDKDSGNSSANKWEEMKARVFSGGKTNDGNDVLALQGVNAQKAGFGIGMGLGYEDLTKKPKK
jgi:hypothetical protein